MEIACEELHSNNHNYAKYQLYLRYLGMAMPECACYWLALQ
jgi:hypothetical protein